MQRSPKAFDFKGLQPPRGYRNINELGDLSNEAWLHPVQSLYGDWNARHLILGQDFNSWNNLNGLAVSELKHNPEFSTNKNLIALFGPNFDAIYGNLSWFIKDGRNASSPVNFTRKVKEANWPILEATISNMPNLKFVYCLGAKVFSALTGQKYEPLTKSEHLLFDKKLQVVAVPHLGGLGLANYQHRTGLSKQSALNKIKQSVIG